MFKGHTALESQRIFHTNKQTSDSQPDDGILATAASSVGAVTGTPSALGSLMSSYGDISSGEEEGEIVEPSHPMPVQSTEKQKSDQKTEKTSPLAQITGMFATFSAVTHSKCSHLEQVLPLETIKLSC